MEAVSSGKESPRRSSSSCSASSFEFWMVGNNNHPETRILAADELFSGGVLLPLHLLSLSGELAIPELPPAANPSPPQPKGERDHVRAESPSIMSGGGGGGLSKRWKEIFMKTGEKKVAGEETNWKKGDGRGLVAHINSKSSRDLREVRGVPSGDLISNPTRYEGPPPPQRYEVSFNEHPQPPRRQTWKKKAVHSSASKEDLWSDVTPPPPELNIKLWPFGFARSRSARNGGGFRPAGAAAKRKASSAPCSRSNSRGDTDGGGVHGRSGVHVGRAVPVWKIKKPGGGGGGGGIRGLNLSVNSCIGYGGRMSCRKEDGGGGVFGIKSFFFSKKVY